jgi:hypothetical protein
MNNKITINCGGTIFVTTRSTIKNISGNVLDRMLDGHFSESKKDEIFIDRSPDIFKVILDFLREGTLFIPPNIPEERIINELEYFCIPCPFKIPYNNTWIRNETFTLVENVCESCIHSEDFKKVSSTNTFVYWKIYSLPDEYIGEYPQFIGFISKCLDYIVIYMKTVHNIKANTDCSCESATLDKGHVNYNFSLIQLNPEKNIKLIRKNIKLSCVWY